MVRGILSEDLDYFWPLVVHHLQRAVEKSEGDFTVEDIYDAIASRDMQLWVWEVESVIKACCVTQIVNYPRRRVMQMPFIAGASMKDWLGAEDYFVQWAKEQGCTQMEGFCRPGWARVLKTWRSAWVTMRRDI